MIGLVSSLVKNPGSFLVSILIAVGVGFIIFMIFCSIVNNRSSGNSNEMKKYKKAAIQTTLTFKLQHSIAKSIICAASPIKTIIKRRSVAHLTVFDGKKNKISNDRASN